MSTWSFFLKVNNIKYSLFGMLFFLSNLPIIFLHHSFSYSDLKKIGLGTVCFLSARCLGVVFNQIVDHRFDKKNIRTALRPIPKGEISVNYALMLSGISLFIFLISGYFLGMHCSLRSLFCIGLILLYSFTKRFSALCHFCLGSIYCIAVINIFSVLTEKFFSYESMFMGLAIGFVIVANDIGYAIQDREFDCQEGLYSLPACCTLNTIFRLITLMYLSSFFCLIGVGIVLSLSYHYYLLLAIPGLAMFLHYSRLSRFFYLKVGEGDLLFKGNFSIALSLAVTMTLFFILGSSRLL